ncbi:hypothetical protein Q1695_010663 [Nippostrongylus brasiliensis]|nr:hypothetical protein Q1695_010663 [Nippostrongylus brasiliensis]
MRNICLTKTQSTSNNDAELLRGQSKLFVEDSAANTAYLIDQENVVVLDADLKLKDVFEWCDGYESPPIGVDFMQDTSELHVILQNGQVITVHADTQTICSACFLSEECLAAAWSPDQAVLVATESDRVVFYTRDYEIISSWIMSSNDIGRDALVTVGWGEAETQFQGSAGKAAREKPVEVVRTAFPNDTRRSYIKWRADGLFVSVSFFEEQSGERRIAVFNKNGELMARLKNTEPIEEAIAMRPTGNYIATTRKAADGRRVMAFYERNGEKRHEMRMSHSFDKCKLMDMQWDIDSSCLCVHLRYADKDELEIWTVSNYDWKCQWVARFSQSILQWEWHTEKAKQMSVLFSDGRFSRLHFASVPIVVDGNALVVASEEFRFTNLNELLIPPPLCEYAVHHMRTIHAVSFDNSRLAVVDGDFNLHTCIVVVEATRSTVIQLRKRSDGCFL